MGATVSCLIKEISSFKARWESKVGRRDLRKTPILTHISCLKSLRRAFEAFSEETMRVTTSWFYEQWKEKAFIMAEWAFPRKRVMPPKGTEQREQGETEQPPVEQV